MFYKVLPLMILIVTVAQAADPVSPPDPLYKDISEAAAKGTVADIQSFLDQGVYVDTKNDGQTPLCRAANVNPSVDVLKFLIANGADISEARSSRNTTALHCAAFYNSNAEILKTLLARGADANAQNNEGKTPLFIADTDEKKTILRAAGGLMMFRSIHDAAEKGTVDDVRFFIDQSVDVNEKGEYEQTPLHVAAESNPDIGVLKYLIEQGADVGAKDQAAMTPLHWAAYKNPSADVLKTLIEHGADIGAKDQFEQMPVHYAAMNDSGADALKYLLEQGADIHATSKYGTTPLHAAVYRNKSGADILKILIEHGADVNAKAHRPLPPNPLSKTALSRWSPFENMTPLDLARTEEHRTILRAAGARATFRYISDNAATVNADDIRSFAEQKTDVNEKNYDGMTLLHIVAQKNPDVDVLNALIAQGADVSAKAELGATPLHYAAWKNTNPLILKWLIVQGANINAQADNGWTPLHSAAVGTSPVEIVQFLINQGADVNAKTDEGGMPLDYAESEEKQTILHDAGGKSAWR